MPLYLIIIICVAACIFILVCLFGLLLLRRFSILIKKLDFLVEDITFKSENIAPFLDSLLKITSYVDVLDVIVKKNINGIKKVVENNASNMKKMMNELEKAVNEKK